MRNPLSALVLFGCLWASGTRAVAQWLETGSASAAALAGATAAAPPGVWQAQGNPAGLAGLAGPAVGLGLQETYLLPELNPVYLAVALPYRGRHGLGLALRTVGVERYRETLAGLAAASQWGPLALGARVSVLVGAFAEFGTQTALLWDAGAQWRLDSTLTLGAWVANATASRYPATAPDVPLPSQVALGLRYTPTPRLEVLAEAAAQPRLPVQLRLAVELAPTLRTRFQVGLQAQPTLVAVGAALNLGPLWLQLAARYDPVLGPTPGLSLERTFLRTP